MGSAHLLARCSYQLSRLKVRLIRYPPPFFIKGDPTLFSPPPPPPPKPTSAWGVVPESAQPYHTDRVRVRVRAYTQAVHTQGGAHTRRSVATAGVLLFTGGAGLAPASSEESRSKGRFGGTHTRRGIHKAVHTQGGLWPLQESCYLRGLQGLAPASSEASRSKGRFGGTRTRQGIHNVVHTQGSLWPLQESCCLREVQGLAPASSKASRLSSKPS